MIPPTTLPATDVRALVRLLRLLFFRTMFRPSQASILSHNNNATSIIGDGSVVNNNNWAISIIQAAAEQVCSSFRAC